MTFILHRGGRFDASSLRPLRFGQAAPELVRPVDAPAYGEIAGGPSSNRDWWNAGWSRGFVTGMALAGVVFLFCVSLGAAAWWLA